MPRTISPIRPTWDENLVPPADRALARSFGQTNVRKILERWPDKSSVRSRQAHAFVLPAQQVTGASSESGQRHVTATGFQPPFNDAQTVAGGAGGTAPTHSRPQRRLRPTIACHS